jgi:hypothetical protein
MAASTRRLRKQRKQKQNEMKNECTAHASIEPEKEKDAGNVQF